MSDFNVYIEKIESALSRFVPEVKGELEDIPGMLLYLSLIHI